MPRTPKKSKPKKKQAKKKQAKKKPEKREPTYHPKNSLNELKGDRWIWFTKTHETTNYPLEYGHKLRKTHGANKPPRLMQEQIEYFTKRDGVVLDPFAGVGGTLIGASIADPPRKAIGIEINQEWIDIYDQVCDEHDLVKQEMLRGDCLKVMRDEIEEESIDFIGTDPPYNIHVDQTMCDGKYGWSNRASDYNMRSDEEHDFANLPDYAAYLDAMLDDDHPAQRLPGRALLPHQRFRRRARRESRPGPEGRENLGPGRRAAAAIRLPLQLRPQHRPPVHPHIAEAEEVAPDAEP